MVWGEPFPFMPVSTYHEIPFFCSNHGIPSITFYYSFFEDYRKLGTPQRRGQPMASPQERRSECVSPKQIRFFRFLNEIPPHRNGLIGFIPNCPAQVKPVSLFSRNSSSNVFPIKGIIVEVPCQMRSIRHSQPVRQEKYL